MKTQALERITRDILNEELDDIIYETRKLANRVQRFTTKLKIDDNYARALHQLAMDIDVAISRKIVQLGFDKEINEQGVLNECI